MIEYDRQHIWHPYTSMTHPLPSYCVKSAEGVNIKLSDGRQLIDGMSSWWCAIHGYNHPKLNAAVKSQLEDMAHIMFGGLTHRGAVTLARHLIELTPEGLDRVFFADSGSVAVEVAIKMAIQYWHAQGKKNKSTLLTVRGGYHGDTFGAMAVCDPINGMHQIFSDVLPKHHFAPRPITPFGEPLQPGDIDEITGIVQQHHNTIAALILEPIVQGAGGMWFYSAQYLRALKQLCEEYDILLIADEIATGFGRTGKWFACEHADISPDILCLGKALTGGYMTMAATLTTQHIAEGISADNGVLMHGPTYMANPLACAVANQSMELLRGGQWQQQVPFIEQVLTRELAQYEDHPNVANIRVLGAIGVVECAEPIDVAAVQKRFVDAGVWIRPFGRLIYLMPPYIIGEAELKQLCRAIGLVLDL